MHRTRRSTQNGKKKFWLVFCVNPTDFLYIVCLFVYFVLLVNGYYTIQSYRLGELYMLAIMPLSYAMQSKVYLDFLTRGVAMIGAGVAHTRLPSVGFRSWSRLLTVSLQVTWVTNPAVGCHYFPPGPQLPSQPLIEGCYQFRWLVNRGTMGVNSLPKTVTRQRRGCDLNQGPSAPESSTLTTRLPSHPNRVSAYCCCCDGVTNKQQDARCNQPSETAYGLYISWWSTPGGGQQYLARGGE